MYHHHSRRLHFRFAIGILLYLQVFFLQPAMSLRADASRATSLPSALEHTLAADGEIPEGGSALVVGSCNIQQVSDPLHGSEELDNGFNSLLNQQECLEGTHVLRATALDSDDGLDSQQADLFGDQFSCELDGWEPVGDADDSQLDKGLSAPQLDEGVDWLLHLNEGDALSLDLCTERLGPDVQPASEPVNPALPGFGVDHSRWALEANSPKFFWETDPFLSDVFGQCSNRGPDLKRPAVDIDLTDMVQYDVMSLLQKPKQTRVAGLCEQVIRHVEMREEADKRQSVVSNWTSLVCISLDAFSVGDAILAAGTQVTHVDVEHSLRACFARKATSTLSKRFYALNRFVNFCGQRGLQFFPLREHVIFTYLQHMLKDENTAASAGRSFLEACRFAKGVLGLRGDLAELGTARVDGVATELSTRAGPIAQATPLLVSQVITLEKLVATTPDLKDRVLFGAMLILLYGCGRFSDGQRAVNMILDADVASIDPDSLECPGYLELQVLGNKGARSEVLRRTFLPLVAPIYSLGSHDWFRAWLQAREALGLETGGRLTVPLLCRFGVDGKPLQQEITSSECGQLLREALRVGHDKGCGVKSHSLKATALSWAGKHGLDLETRRLLGHHLDANAKSAEAYNRDSMGPAVTKLVGTLQAIKQGVFLPDASRSGRFVHQSQAGIPANQEQSDSDSSFVPSSSDSSDSEDDVFSGPADSTLLWHLVVPELRPGFVDIPESCTVYRNNVSGMQHLKLHGSLKFLCGRRECNRYTYFAGKPVKGVAMCEHCMGSRDLNSRG